MQNLAFLLLFALAGYANTASLNHLQYLPPPSSNSIQKHQQGLETPKFSQPSPGQYQQPTAGFQQQSNQPIAGNQYGAPSAPQPAHGFQQAARQPANNQQYGPPAAQGYQQPIDNQFGNPSAQQGSQQQYPEQHQPQQEQPRSPLADVPILRLDNENPGDGTYRYAYETGNDIAAQEEGSALSGWNKAQGSYRFVSPEGQNFEITYTADENGYVPQGAHLPTPPPIPEAILKSLEVIRQAEAAGNVIEGAYRPEGDDGQYHESHDDGQYDHQSAAGHSGNGYQQNFGSAAPNQGGPVQTQTGHQQQPTAPNGGYRY